MLYTFLVNIVTLSGRHEKENPVRHLGSAKSPFSGVYIFLYIVDMTTFFG